METRNIALTCASKSALARSSLIIRFMRSRCRDLGTTAINSSMSSSAKEEWTHQYHYLQEKMPKFHFNFKKIEGTRSNIPFTCFNELYQPLSESTASCDTFLLFKSERSCSVVGFFRSITVLKLILRWNEKKTSPRSKYRAFAPQEMPRLLFFPTIG